MLRGIAFDIAHTLSTSVLLLSFALLGVFPLIARRGLAVLQARRAWAKWPRPRRFERNLVVIGAGAAGLVRASDRGGDRRLGAEGSTGKRPSVKR